MKKISNRKIYRLFIYYQSKFQEINKKCKTISTINLMSVKQYY